MAEHDWYSDTDPKTLKVFLDLQRQMPPGEKAAQVFRLRRMLVRITEANERALHPDADDREIFLRVAAHSLDRVTMLRVYGADPARDSHD